MPWSPKETLVTVAKSRYTLVVLGGCAILFWLRFAPPTAPWSPRSVAGYILPEPRVIERVVKETVPGPVRIKVVPKEKIRIVYRDLPTSGTLANDNALVTAVATIPPSPDGGTAVAVLTQNQAGEGVGSIEYKPATPPFFKIKRAFSAEGWYFPAGNRVAEAALVVNPLRIGPVEVKGKVGVDMERESSTLRGFAGVGIEVKF